MVKTTKKSKKNLPKTRSSTRKKQPIKIKPSDEIAKSQQLLQKSSGKKRKVENNPKSKSMPSRSLLKQYYEDTDSDEEGSATLEQNKSNCDVEITPEMAKTIGEKFLKELPKLCNEINEPSLPVIPMKNQKKSDVPYIVGCKDRPKIPENQTRTATFCKGDNNYGVSSTTNALNNNEDDNLKKDGCSSVQLSKSIFNAQANEIANKLKSNEVNDLKLNSKSSVITDHNLNHSEIRFSPLPSTSKDNETIRKNEQKFNESVAGKNESRKCFPLPIPTIIIDDDDDEDTTSKSIKRSGEDDHNKCKRRVNTENEKNPIIVNDVEINIIDDEVIEIKDKLPLSKINTRNAPQVMEENHTASKVIDLSNEDECLIYENKSLSSEHTKSQKLKTVSHVKPQQECNQEVSSTVTIPEVRNNQKDTPNTTLSNTDLENIVKFFFDTHLPESIKYVYKDEEMNNDIKAFINSISEIPINSNKGTVIPGSGRNATKENKFFTLKHIIGTKNEPSLGTCPICKDKISQKKIASTNCGHIFCLPCIKRAVITMKRCPNCRKVLSGVGYHRIFI